MNERQTVLTRGTLALLLTGGLVGSPAAQAQTPGCAVWSKAENRCLQQAPAARGRGAQPLTAATLAAAQAVQTGDDIVSSPLLIAMMARGVSDPSVREKTKDAPFFVNISTPFTRAAWITIEARRTFQNPVFPSLDTLNANRLVVSVSPGSSLLTVDTIENVIIKHGDMVTKPLRAEVHPTVVQNAVGVKKESAEGGFVFDFYVFDPQYGPLTLVLIGKRGNFEWEMTADDLSKLK